MKLKMGQGLEPKAGKFFDAIFNDPVAEESQSAARKDSHISVST